MKSTKLSGMELARTMFDAMSLDDDKASKAVEALGQHIREFRLAIGANDHESTEDALLRYTFAVQLGCARRLEIHAAAIRDGVGRDTQTVFDGVRHSAALLRIDVPEQVAGRSDCSPAESAVGRWRDEQIQAIKDGWLGSVFDRFWQEVMGGIPADAARERFRQLLEEYEPGKETETEANEGPTQIQDEQPRPDSDEDTPMSDFEAGLHDPMDDDT